MGKMSKDESLGNIKVSLVELEVVVYNSHYWLLYDVSHSDSE